MTDLGQLIPVGIRLLGHKAEIDEILRRAMPVIDAAEQAIPGIIPLAKALIAEVAPQVAEAFGAGKFSTLEIKAVQHALNALGEHVDPDGFIGEHTRAAIERFQTRHGIQPDGWPGTRTLMALGAALDQKNKLKEVLDSD